ncbi:MAG: nucleotidyltransferase domain-containing protein [Candidatus Jordarchaeum sp.]|uniref:nucleotidyltransferase domain-containing protein n=1 Tax=Candidatus Jordarchaeum sp. TaxID=2823881 RepID=UPI0040492EBC
MELVSLTSEGRIVLTLKHGKHTYSELKLETGLSDRWLTIKLELEGEGVVEKSGKCYGLKKEISVSPYEFSLYMISQAKRIANELANLRFVKAVILFGSVAQRNAGEYSDLDMIIVVSEPYDRVKTKTRLEISRQESKYHITIETLILTKGFEILGDKTGEFDKILRNRVEEIKRSHDY